MLQNQDGNNILGLYSTTVAPIIPDNIVCKTLNVSEISILKGIVELDTTHN